MARCVLFIIVLGQKCYISLIVLRNQERFHCVFVRVARPVFCRLVFIIVITVYHGSDFTALDRDVVKRAPHDVFKTPGLMDSETSLGIMSQK
jgi:hypothetical protein